MTHGQAVATTFLVALWGTAMTVPATAQWSLAANDGKAVFNVGFLAQTQAEVLENPGSQDFARNLFVRRARLMMGGRIDGRTAFFIDTDVPNLGKGQASGTKVANSIVLQDLVLTRILCRGVKLDAGMLMVPMSHNSQQAVATVLPVDYGPYSFLQSDATDSRINRDYGLDARAYFAKQHGELRAGLYQGSRGSNATAPFRATIRGVYYPFEADTGFFYSGTAFGKKKIVAIGGSYDAQKSYAAWAADMYVDWPLGLDCLTLQADFMRYDGGTTFTTLPRQNVLLLEMGYYFRQVRLTPFVQYATRDYAAPGMADEARIQGGVAFWCNGHRDSFKLAVTKLTRDGATGGRQYVAQWQVLAF